MTTLQYVKIDSSLSVSLLMIQYSNAPYFFPLTEPCPTGWVVAPNKAKCFYHVRKLQSWNDSEACCNKYGGHLASLRSLPELHFAQSICGEIFNNCWVGGRRFNSAAGYKWTWSDNSQWNESLFPLALDTSNCTGLSCPMKSTVNLCTRMTNHSNSLMSDSCNNPLASVCVLDTGVSLLYNSWFSFYIHLDFCLIILPLLLLFFYLA